MNFSSNAFYSFNNNNCPVIICDTDFNILDVNLYVKENNISICVSDNLYNYSLENNIILSLAFENLKKGLPFNASNFSLGLFKANVFFFPVMQSKQSLASIICFIESPLENMPETNSQDIIQTIYKHFQAPITRIINTLSPIAHKLELLEQYEDLEYLNSIASNCYQMLKNSVMISEYYKLINSQVTLKPQKIVLNSYLDELIKALQIMLMDSNHNIIFEPSNGLVITEFDEEYLSIALFHIILNSCMFSPRDSTIKLSLKSNNGFAYITVTDEGEGISNEDLSKIFTPFYCNSSKIQAKELNGLGIGLPTAKKIIETMGGNIFVSSGQSNGASVSLSIPIKDELSSELTLKTNSRKYFTNRFSNMYIYFSEICNISFY